MYKFLPHSILSFSKLWIAAAAAAAAASGLSWLENEKLYVNRAATVVLYSVTHTQLNCISLKLSSEHNNINTSFYCS